MKTQRTILVFLALVGALILAGCQLPPPPVQAAPLSAEEAEAERQAIQALFDRFSTAWDQADVAAMSQTYAADGVLWDPFNQRAAGREAIARQFEATLTTILAGSHTAFTVEHVRFLKPDVAFIDATQTVSNIKGPDGAPVPDAVFHLVATVVKVGGHWRFVDVRPYVFLPLPGQ
ncbi:MAG: hypothetical protein KatS3mg050_5029 [Litorilinea sp.]|nr:MAG: hypothetical protein KatS3mg050_5029 [Litorilinea sp.]